MKVHFAILLNLLFIYDSLIGFKGTYADQECELSHKGDNYEFPTDFSFGVATAAYQIEGAWDEDGKAPSIWDIYTHEHPELIADGSNGDEAADSYHRFDQDLTALKELKVNFYRFSISWSRVLPNADTSVINEKAVNYYNMVIDELLENNIEPMVTMSHFDLPEMLSERDGFLNSSIITSFQTYADFLYETFGDRVKLWITFNEPYVVCELGYASASYPPLVHSPGVGDYICMDNILRSHAVAYRLYKEKYFDSQNGRVGISFNSFFFQQKYNETSNEAFVRAMEYWLGWIAYPIYGDTGNYPSLMIDDIGNNSLNEGLTESRLPVINETWAEIIKGSGDFLGLNYYTTNYVEMASPPEGEVPSWEYDSQIKYSVDDNWRRAKSDWLYCVPQGMEDILKWIRDNYNNVEVFVTENGWSDDGQLDDSDRIDYLKAHLQAILNAINDGCNVTRYTHWSVIDNFEWNQGYSEKFGLYYVNMTDENKERTAKNSAAYYRSVIESRIIPTTSSGFTIQPSHYCSLVLISYVFSFFKGVYYSL